MVEGHSVHRISHRHTRLLVGHKFKATSPNNRFTEGAKAINQKTLRRAEAKGKQLFYWFSNAAKNNELSTLREAKDVYVVNIHFGMSGQFHTFGLDKEAPEPTPTTRLRLERDDEKVTAHLSAMTCLGGGVDLYDKRAGELGEDPLRDDADPEALFAKIQKCTTTQTIGRLLMDQRFFPGVGNIYRCECLFVAGVWPNAIARDLSRANFAKVWSACVKLLRRGFETGSILTVDPDEGIKARRYIYNRSTCARCGSHVLSWDVAARTCYGCPTCQPIGKVSAVTAVEVTETDVKVESTEITVTKTTPTRHVPRSRYKKKGAKASAPKSTTKVVKTKTKAKKKAIEMKTHVPFPSSCARSDPSALAIERAYTAMRVADLRQLCADRHMATKGNKATLIDQLKLFDDNEPPKLEMSESAIEAINSTGDASIVIKAPKSTNYSRMRIAELVQLCVERQLDGNGRKSDLVQRLRAHTEIKIVSEATSTVTETADSDEKPTTRSSIRTRRTRQTETSVVITGATVPDGDRERLEAPAVTVDSAKGVEKTPARKKRKWKVEEAEVTPTATTYDLATLQPLRVVDLGIMCAARGLSTRGRKRQLIDRILASGEETSAPKANVHDSGVIVDARDTDAIDSLAIPSADDIAFESPGRFLIDNTKVASYREAAREKERANEARNVEHVADIDWTDLKGE